MGARGPNVAVRPVLIMAHCDLAPAYFSTKQNEKWKLAFLDFSKGTLSSSDSSFEIHLEDGVIAIGEILLLDIASFLRFQIDVLQSRVLIGQEWWSKRQFENKPE